MTLHDDPQLARALAQVDACRDLLAHLERIFRLPRRFITADLHYPFRALTASQHNLAQAWNLLASIPVPVEPDPVSASPTVHPKFREIEARGHDITK